MPDEKSILNAAKNLLTEEQSIESVLSFFRKQGISKMRSIIFLTEISGRNLEEATLAVHSSLTWRDVAEIDEGLMDSFYDLLENDKL